MKILYICPKETNHIKFRIIITVATVIIVIVAVSYFIIGNPVIAYNNRELRKSITSISTETAKINEVVPFDWDVVYTFEPYTSKEQIEEIIGFKHTDIQENQINEGMVQLLFVSEKKVVASVLGYAENLGYRLDFSEKANCTDAAVFEVRNLDDVVTLTFAE